MRFQKQVDKAKEKGRSIATVRGDVVRRIIEKQEYKAFRCDYRMTDDYAWDNASGFGKGQLSSTAALEVAKDWLEKGQVTARCWIEVDKPNEVTILPYSNLSYTMVVE